NAGHLARAIGGPLDDQGERWGELPKRRGVSAASRGLQRDRRSTALTRNAPAKRRRALAFVVNGYGPAGPLQLVPGCAPTIADCCAVTQPYVMWVGPFSTLPWSVQTSAALPPRSITIEIESARSRLPPLTLQKMPLVQIPPTCITPLEAEVWLNFGTRAVPFVVCA